MKNFKVILFVILCTITAFSVFKYIAAQREKNILFYTLKQIEQQVSALQKEKQGLEGIIEKEKELQKQLSEENKGLKENLKVAEEKLVESSNNFTQARETIEELNSQLAILRDERDRLLIQFSETAQEKDKLMTRVSSIAGLKKAIRELKLQMQDAGHQTKRKAKTYMLREGNHGFLMRNGVPTFSPKIKIKVEPALKE